MIISSKYGFCFIHVPKTGGTTIRRQISHLDDEGGRFGGKVARLPEGNFRLAHLPLDVIRNRFPEVLETLRPLEKFAIVRDPESRFFSAALQHLKESHGKFENELSDAELRAVLLEIRDHIVAADPYPDTRYTHFLRQTDFTHLAGSRFVERVFPIEKLDLLAQELAARTGAKVDSKIRLNESVSFRNQKLKRPVIFLKDSLKEVLPVPIYSRLKSAAVSVLATRKKSERLQTIAEKLMLKDFVREHYAGDFALRQQALKEMSIDQEASHAR